MILIRTVLCFNLFCTVGRNMYKYAFCEKI